jgi:undecaprenyl-diphosphatase
MSHIQYALVLIQRWDRTLCVRLNGTLRFSVVLHGFRAVSWLGDGIFWYALMLALLLQQGRGAATAVVHMVCVGFVCTAVYKALKRSTLRPRPYEVLSVVARGAAPLDAFSFPSGHTLHAVAFTLVAATYYPWLAALLAPFTLLVAASRVVLGLHYPSDVLAGAAIGASIAGFSFLLL